MKTDKDGKIIATKLCFKNSYVPNGLLLWLFPYLLKALNYGYKMRMTMFITNKKVVYGILLFLLPNK